MCSQHYNLIYFYLVSYCQPNKAGLSGSLKRWQQTSTSHRVITHEKSSLRRCIEGRERNTRHILTGSIQHTEIHQKNILSHYDPLTLKQRCQAHKQHHKYLPHSLSITEKQRGVLRPGIIDAKMKHLRFFSQMQNLELTSCFVDMFSL